MAFYSAKKEYEVVPYDGGPCAVCGEAGGNCKGDSEFGGSIQVLPPKGDDFLATFTVPERVYEEEIVNGRRRRTLVHPKGARIRPEEAKRLGLL